MFDLRIGQFVDVSKTVFDLRLGNTVTTAGVLQVCRIDLQSVNEIPFDSYFQKRVPMILDSIVSSSRKGTSNLGPFVSARQVDLQNESILFDRPFPRLDHFRVQMIMPPLKRFSTKC